VAFEGQFGKDVALMPTRLAELANLVQGNVVGDGQVLVRGAAPLTTARSGEITFIDQPDKLRLVSGCQAAAVVVPGNLVPASHPAIQVTDIHAAFATIVTHFRPRRQSRRVGVSPRAVVSPSAVIAGDVEIHPGATIGDDVEIGAGSTIHSGARVMAGCRIGLGVTIFPNAVLYEDTIVGPRCIIHAGAVVGAYGFGYKQVNGRHQLASQLGFVELGPDVEIGAGATIDRGTYGPTIIGEGSKLDDQVMIGHNCRIGRHNLLCSQVGVAGSSSTGDYVVMAGQVGISDHIHVGDRAVLCAKSGVSNDVEPGTMMFGYPASPLREQRRCIAVYHKLPEMRQQLRDLEKTIEALRRQLDHQEAAPLDQPDDQGGHHAAA
jgi:UDP-3-O-[3-hydroxymyristoyl] glucosamine N-acyltransferase